MKKIQKLFIATLALLLMNIANALEIVDVRSDYWAGQEIVRAIQNGYIYVIDGNKFKPEGIMTRSEFVTALLKVIQRQDEKVTKNTSFKDVDGLTPNRKSVVLSEQIRMAFGYPDKTFKPNIAINHNETMSMIANITNANYGLYVAEKTNNFYVFAIGGGNDIQINRKGVPGSFCIQRDFNYDGIQNALCGERNFTPKRFTVIQMI